MKPDKTGNCNTRCKEKTEEEGAGLGEHLVVEEPEEHSSPKQTADPKLGREGCTGWRQVLP